MSIRTFGKNQQVIFNNDSEYYEFIGFLAKNDNSTKLKWEHNDVKGTAWGKEGRIEFFVVPNSLSCSLKHTAGNGERILSRVNCNDFVQHLRNNHNFIEGFAQNIDVISQTIPTEYKADFDRGLNM